MFPNLIHRPCRVELDKSIIENILWLLGDSILSLIRFSRLGEMFSDAVYPLKIIL